MRSVVNNEAEGKTNQLASQKTVYVLSQEMNVDISLKSRMWTPLWMLFKLSVFNLLMVFGKKDHVASHQEVY
ncbi:MAG: hypothetical protein ACTS77_01120 [Arsenophonus sp. NC-TX2-MAG3]